MVADEIWRRFQTEAPAALRNSEGRLKYLARQARRRTHAGARVLNVGIGAGLFEDWALKRGLEVYSLDPDRESCALLEQRTEMNGRTRAGRLQEIPFAGESFEAVVISEVLEHVPADESVRSMSEINRVLIPGGLIIGTVPARENLMEQLVFCPHCGESFHRWGHVQSFDRAKLTNLLADSFEVLEVKERYLDSWSQLNWKGKLASLVRRTLAAMGARGSGNVLYFIAAKR